MRHTILLMLVTVLFFNLSGVARAVPTPLVYFPLETSVANQGLTNQGQGGLTYNPTVVGTPVPGTSGGIGGGNFAQLIKSETDALLVSPASTANLGQNFTIATWFRNDFVGSISSDANRNFVFESEGNFDVSFGTGSSTSGPDNYTPFVAETSATAVSLARNTWHHVAHTFSSNGTTTTLNSYVNGVLQATQTAPTSSMNVAGINFGRHRAAGRYLQGGLDEIAIWNQTLSATDVADVYAAGTGNLGLPNQEFDVAMASTYLMNFNAGTLPIAQGWTVENVAITAGPNNDLSDAGMSGQYARTVTSGDNIMTLNLSNLPTHSHVNLGMLMAQLDSLDGFRDGDRFIVELDDVEILNARMSYGTSVNLAFTDGLGNVFIEVDGNPTLSAELAGLRTISETHLYGDSNFEENVYDLAALSAFQMIPHTGSTLKLEIIGRQNQASGEFFAIDDVSFEFVVIPEPSSLAMLAFGALAILLFRKK